MPKITYNYEKTIANAAGKLSTQVLEISCTASNYDEIDALGYEDYTVCLYIDNKFVADITPVIGVTRALVELIDAVDWREQLAGTLAETY